VQFQVLGPLEVRRGHLAVALRGRRQRALLAVLLVHAGRVVSIDALADALWGEDAPADPRNAIQTHVARLRQALGPQPPIATRPPGYALEVDAAQLDALRFEELLAEAQHHGERPSVVRELLDEALSLWRGPAYAEFADRIAHGEALRLDARRRAAAEERAAVRLALGEAAELVGEAEEMVARDPLGERWVGLLMESLATVNRPREALAVYRRYRDQLAEETGLEPSMAVRSLEARILRGEVGGKVGAEDGEERSQGVGAADRRRAPSSPRASASSAGPLMATSLVGRAREVAEVRALLSRERFVTLTGPGGVGKTRVAAAVVFGPEADDDSEVGWVELAPITDPSAVDHVVAAALGVDVSSGRSARTTLIDVLRSRTLLLVLDNCEHLLDPVATLVEQVVRGCPDVRVLATSRERLAVEGEWVRPVKPLPVSAESGAGHPLGAGAVQLFLERAAAAGAHIELPRQRPMVTAICHLLDGVPLAVELAAARTGALSLDDLAASLRADLAGGAGRRRAGTSRHRDLWAVTDWSYRMLTPDAQGLFERLGIFAGTFSAEVAAEVCNPEPGAPWSMVDQLAGLAERSLLVVAEPGRYRMLRPLRAFARQRLADRGQLNELAARHAAVLVARAELAAGPPLRDEGRRWLEAVLDDLREARRRALVTNDAALLSRLIAALYRFDYWRPGAELMGWAEDALEVEGIADQPAAPQVHAAAAAAAWRRGEFDRARELSARGVELATRTAGPTSPVPYEAAGDVATFEGRLDDAEAAFREEVRLGRINRDPDSEVLGLTSTALVLAYAGRAAEGITAADAAAGAATRSGPAAAAFARYAQGECRAEVAPEQALVVLDEAIVLAERCEASFVEGVARLTAASVRGRRGETAAAVPAFADVIVRWQRSGNWAQQWTTLRNLAELLVVVGCDEPAAVIAASADEQTAAPTFGAESDRLGRALVTARERLGQAAFDAARDRGSRMDPEDVVELALTTLGELVPERGRPRDEAG
jgi:predicted ATPase/DNA-binding SARP family transcriptional activator